MIRIGMAELEAHISRNQRIAQVTNNYKPPPGIRQPDTVELLFRQIEGGINLTGLHGPVHELDSSPLRRYDSLGGALTEDAGNPHRSRFPVRDVENGRHSLFGIVPDNERRRLCEGRLQYDYFADGSADSGGWTWPGLGGRLCFLSFRLHRFYGCPQAVGLSYKLLDDPQAFLGLSFQLRASVCQQGILYSRPLEQIQALGLHRCFSILIEGLKYF